MRKSHEEGLINKEHIAFNTDLNLKCLNTLIFSGKTFKIV